MPDPQDLSRVEQFMSIKYVEKRWIPKPAEKAKPPPPAQPQVHQGPPQQYGMPPPMRGAFYLDEVRQKMKR